MSIHNIQAEHHLGFQNQVEREIMNVSDLVSQQIHKSDSLPLAYKGVLDLSSTTDIYFFSMNKVKRELDEIREEVEETCVVANDVYPVPESAYTEAFSLLARVHRNIPMPDMMWLEDGGIGLEWRPGDGIVTMSLYGDNYVTFVAILGNQHEIAGTCPLSDSRLLPSFLATLPVLFR